ncbi:MAG: hypothetical protein ACRC92_20130 [Peptostreptococcaceae bacterium]
MIIKILDFEILTDERIKELQSTSYTYVTFSEDKLTVYKKLGFENISVVSPFEFNGGDFIED